MALNILLLEPYYGGSHQAWADGYHRFSKHNLTLLTLPAQAWKWRMQGGAITLARQFLESNLKPDVILASDMMDVSTWRAITRHRTHNIPHALYFHENQLTYPQNERQGHGWRYGFINYASAMSSDALFFNSEFHLTAFFNALPKMLKHFYDYNELDTVDILREKARVLWLGMDLHCFDKHKISSSLNKPPLILWNHRWEKDKNPKLFLKTLYRLKDVGIPFRVAILGENVRHSAPEFEKARRQLGACVIAFGYQEHFANYAQLLWQADYVISTANQEFFGGAIAEAIYCGCIPILPNRLNYPNLIPKSTREACLYNEDRKLFPLLMQHLTGKLTARKNALQRHISQFNWSNMAPHYDETLTRLFQAQEALQDPDK